MNTKTETVTLQTIVQHKRREVDAAKELYPRKLLEQSMYYRTPVVSLKSYLQRSDRAGVIAEIKRRSPSRGMLKEHVSVEQLSIGYMQSGASALSVLTDKHFFGGGNDDLTVARRFNFCPILRKDFIIDEYQVHEARAIGADAVLLIAKALSGPELAALSKAAQELGLEVLLELHDEADLEKIPHCSAAVLGVNNRNLDDFSVDIERSFALVPLLPKGAVAISESGIKDGADLKRLRAAGFCGALIGEHFMRQSDPALACLRLIEDFWRGQPA